MNGKGWKETTPHIWLMQLSRHLEEHMGENATTAGVYRRTKLAGGCRIASSRKQSDVADFALDTKRVWNWHASS